ncbi:hypothetical protein BFM98_06710 [Lysinibacillus sp. AR18-8]|uniref:hypothetical protein n=1 Tax=Lysinibacillus sp. AR18-8 TaxID=1889781 RepID=UPI0008257292|nr:hypothetical protein [Lysinibacillus sp. AR18-8]OCX64724.1 hypothetical protein BFM98_06710 [Lysinibacillus sp. AR18-8]
MENPALKLHSILHEICSYQTNANIQDACFGAFKIENGNFIELAVCLNNLQNLLNETKILTEQHEQLNIFTTQKFLQRTQVALEKINFKDNLGTFKSYMNDETLTALSYIAQSINFNYTFSNSNINTDTINELQVDIEELIISISESELPPEAKALLIKNLYSIKSALHHYILFGEQELIKTLEETIGSIFVNNETLTEVNGDQNVSRFFGVIDKLNSLLELGSSINDKVLPFVKEFMKIS